MDDRTLDIQIAERLMGLAAVLRWCSRDPECGGWGECESFRDETDDYTDPTWHSQQPCYRPYSHNPDAWRVIPAYSADWNEIKPIAAAMRERGCVLSITQSADGYGARFRRDWETGAISGDRLSVVSYDADMAKAVCLAALKVLDMEVSHG